MKNRKPEGEKMPKGKNLTREPSKLTVRNAEGREKIVTVDRFRLERLAVELGFDSEPHFLSNNPHVLFLFGHRTELHPEQKEPEQQLPTTPEQIEQALAILLRAIARAALPKLAMAPPPPGEEEEEEKVDGRPPIEITRREGCDCPCPDGVTVEFLIEYDAPGLVNPDLFSDSLKRGRTENPQGQPKGTTVEVEGDKTVSLNFGNPALGQLNAGDIIVTFTIKPFFKDGFSEDECCITATGSFVGTATIASFTNRGTPNQKVVRGRTNINETIQAGECEGKVCCTAIYRWNFAKGFGLKALGFDVDSRVKGIITVEIKIWEKD